MELPGLMAKLDLMAEQDHSDPRDSKVNQDLLAQPEDLMEEPTRKDQDQEASSLRSKAVPFLVREESSMI